VRGFFAYHPPPLWPAEFSQAALDAALLHGASTERGQAANRGFIGQLRNLRTPFGLATITSGIHGVSIALQDQDSSGAGQSG